MNETASDKVRCPNEGCKVAESGLCLEGLEIEACPFLNPARKLRDEETADDAISDEAARMVHEASEADKMRSQMQSGGMMSSSGRRM